MGGSGHLDCGHAGSVDVGVVGQHVAVEGGVLECGHRVVVGHRSVVDRVDGDGDGGDIAVDGAVVEFVCERVGAGVVEGGRVGVGAVGVEVQRSVGDSADQGGGERVPVGVSVVRQDVAVGDGS